MAHLDGTNLRLLDLLQADARTSVIDLARSVDRAESTVRERIAALERDGVLRGYRALVDAERLGYQARALVRADVDRRRVPEVAKRLAAVPNVVSVCLTTGAKPLVVEVVAENLARLEQVLQERIAPLELEGLEVEVVLRPLLEARPPPLPHPNGAPAPVPAPAPLEVPSIPRLLDGRRPLPLQATR